jgi:hypothetical protein
MEESISPGQVWEMVIELRLHSVINYQRIINLIPGDRFIVLATRFTIWDSDEYQWIRCSYWGDEFELRDSDFGTWAHKIDSTDC